MNTVQIYDTTLRDGTQAEYFSLTQAEKIVLVQRMDMYGFHYIEGGWPGANPKDLEFFEEMKNRRLKYAKLTAFGSTHHPLKDPESDALFQSLIEAGTDVVTIFGKSSVLHVREVLKVSRKRNLEIVSNSIAYLKGKVREVFFDAEHFFDGFKEDRDYALLVLRTASEAGADCLVLCETNGGWVAHKAFEVLKAVKEMFPNARLGIHAHNDSDCAVATSLTAIELGYEQVQGTINGFGERCGNANLCSIIPSIELKMERTSIPLGNLPGLTALSRFVYELSNLRPDTQKPYVGKSAFAHKGGVHVSAYRLYEHIDPKIMGQERRFPVSDLSGRGTIRKKAKQLGLDLSSADPVAKEVLRVIKDLENQGFQFESAEASFELLLTKAMGKRKKYFEYVGHKLINQGSPDSSNSDAIITILVNGDDHGKPEEFRNVGVSTQGPVDALNFAIVEALIAKFPMIENVKLDDFKVRTITLKEGTKAIVRVLAMYRDQSGLNWSTVGVSHDIIIASVYAILDGYKWYIMKNDPEYNK